MKKRTRIIISSILSLVLLFGCIPISIFSSSALEIEPEILPSDTKITEIEEYRGENEKHFSLPDGTIEAVAYPQAVHRLDSNGEWKDIDNSIALKTSGTKRLYSTNDSRVTFAAGYAKNEELVTLKENGYSISMSLIDNQNLSTSKDTLSFTHVENAEKKRGESFDTLEEATKVDNRSLIAYSDVMKDTNIEYILSGNDIKENIVVKARRDSYEYSFVLSLDGLVAELQEDTGEIYLLDKDEVKYIIPAPYMYDSNDNYSDAVSYELLGAEKGKYILTVIADDEWINSDSRAFPVRIDPTVSSTGLPADTYVNSKYPSSNYGSAYQIPVYETTTVLLKPDIPSVPISAIINSATLNVYYYMLSNAPSTVVDAYQITKQWSESGATYNSMLKSSGAGLSIGSSVLDSKSCTYSSTISTTAPGGWNIPVTTLVSNYYDMGEPFYGIALKSNTDNASVLFLPREMSSSNAAKLTVNYTPSTQENSTYYLFESVQYSNTVVQITGGSSTSGAKMGMSELARDAGNYQKWKIVFVGDGYSKITSKHSGMALTSNGSGQTLVQQVYSGNNNQLWKIQRTSSGNYVLKPKSNENIAMSAASSNGVARLSPYSDDVTYNDEWNIAKIGYMSETATLEGKQGQEWCWAAAARMFAKHYDSNGVPDNLTQRKAVAYAYSKPETDTSLETLSGSTYHAQRAINYYMEVTISPDDDFSDFVAEDKDNLIYPKATLISILDQQNVLYISRWAKKLENGVLTESKGHSTLIYGYVIIDMEYWFLIRDPDPMVSSGIVGGKSDMMTYNQIRHHQYNVGNITMQEYWFASVIHKSVPANLRNSTVSYVPFS